MYHTLLRHFVVVVFCKIEIKKRDDDDDIEERVVVVDDVVVNMVDGKMT